MFCFVLFLRMPYVEHVRASDRAAKDGAERGRWMADFRPFDEYRELYYAERPDRDKMDEWARALERDGWRRVELHADDALLLPREWWCVCISDRYYTNTVAVVRS